MSPEAKRKKFKELAEKRVSRAIKDIRLIGNLSNRSLYGFADDDIHKITRALRREIEAMIGRFQSKTEKRESLFTL